MKLKRTLSGGETGGDVLAVQRALNAAPSRTTIAVTKEYDETTERRMRAFRKANSLPGASRFDQMALDVLDEYFDAYGKLRYSLYRPPKPPAPKWAEIGPVVKSGPSVLLHDPTHQTEGIKLFIAFDTAFSAGLEILAPEDMVVDTKLTSANPGEAFYATGVSGMRWWIAHHDKQWPLGTRLQKGAIVGRVIPTDIGGGAHCHVAMNVEAFLGKGKQLKYGKTGNGPDYTHGSPTVGEQLEQALV